MSIDIIRNSCLRLRLWFIYFENRVINFVGSFGTLRKVSEKKKSEKAWVGPFLIYLAKEIQHIIFYAHVHACSPNYTEEE